MKKTLYSTTVLAAAGLFVLSAGDAFAQAAAPKAEKMKLSLGGYMLQWFGWADQDTDWEKANNNHYKSFDQSSDSEIHFRGSLKLDNGLTVGVNMQLESDVQTSGGSVQMDESFMTIGSTTFGTLYLGSTDGAAANLGVQAPSSGALGMYGGDMGNWIVAPAGSAASSVSTNASAALDDNLVKYISPSILGFQAGVSYAASTVDSDNIPSVAEVDQWETGLRYSQKFGGFGVRAAATYWRTEGATETAQTDNWHLGADVTFADFTFGGSYGETEHDGLSGMATLPDTETFNVGLKYAPGPFDVAFTYGRRTATNTVADPDDDTHNRYVLGANYTLGPGVTLKGTAMRITYDDEAPTAANENDGWAVVGGIQVDF